MRNNLTVLLRHKASLSRATGPSFTGTKRVMSSSMEQSPSSEVSTSSVEIFPAVSGTRLCYCVHMNTIVGQTASVHTLPSCLLKIPLSIIITSMSRSPKRSPSCTLRHYNPTRISLLLHACHDHPNNICSAIQATKPLNTYFTLGSLC
jgi:hypothetical protein